MTSPQLEPVFQLIPPAPRREEPAHERDDGSFRKHLAAAEPDHREATTKIATAPLDSPSSASGDETSPVGKDDPSERREKSTASDTDNEPQHLKTATSKSADSPDDVETENPADAEVGTNRVTDAAIDKPTDAPNAAAKGDIATVDPQMSSTSGPLSTNAKAADASASHADKSDAATPGTTGRNLDSESTDGSAAIGTTNSKTSSETPSDAQTTIPHPQSDADAAPDEALRTSEADPDPSSDERPTSGRARSNSAHARRTHTSSTALDPRPAINAGQHQEAPTAPDSVTLPEGAGAGTDGAATQVDDSPATHSTARPPAGAPFAGSTLGRPTHIGTAAGNPTAGRQRIDPARFVARVAKALRMVDERGGQLRLRLSPPELGSIRLELAVKNGAVTATIETETTAARSALLDNLPLLRERLNQQDFRVAQFEVTVRDEGGGNAHEHATGNRERQSVPIPRDQQAGDAGREDDAESESRPVRHTISRGDETLNVVA